MPPSNPIHLSFLLDFSLISIHFPHHSFGLSPHVFFRSPPPAIPAFSSFFLLFPSLLFFLSSLMSAVVVLAALGGGWSFLGPSPPSS
jgi:hypothetical protein